MGILSCKNKSKFLRRVQEWIRLRGNIPLKFIDFIQSSIAEIEVVVKKDQADFWKAVSELPAPTHFQFRAMACVYPIVGLPPNVSEQEAIAIAKQYIKTHRPNDRYPVIIQYPHLNLICITADDHRTTYHEPRIETRKDHVSFPRGALWGTVTIGGRVIPGGLFSGVINNQE